MTNPAAEQIRPLFEKISASDREAFDSLFRSLYPRLVRFAFRYTRSKAVAGDIVQDVFVMLWEKRRDIDPNRSPVAYLYSSVRNRSLNYIRDHSAESVGLDPVSDSITVSSDNTEHSDENNQLMKQLKKWISDLPDRQREAFTLSRFDGLDHDEIAEVMDVSSNTVNNHIVAALDNLRKCCDEYQKKQANSI